MISPPHEGAKRRPSAPARVGACRWRPAARLPTPAEPSEWRDIDRLEDLGRLDEPHRLRLGQPMWSLPAAPLFEADAVPERIATPHRARMLASGAEIYAVPGHDLGGYGLLQRHGRVWVNDAVLPPYMNDPVQPDRLAMPDFWTRSLLAADAEIIETDTPVGVVLHPNMIYGHFLLEMLPRLLLLAHLRTLAGRFRWPCRSTGRTGCTPSSPCCSTRARRSSTIPCRSACAHPASSCPAG